MITQAVVLAGGFGTRLQSVVADLPKPMATVAGKPFITYILDYLIVHGVNTVVLAVGYKHESIIQHFGESYNKLKIIYSVEEQALGTGGGILQAAHLLQSENLFVINGDTFFNVQLQQLGAFHMQKKTRLTVALKRMYNFDRYGTVEIDGAGKIIDFKEKKFLDQGLINGGVYCLNRTIFPPQLPKVFSFEKEILETGFVGEPYYGLEFSSYFIDIGIPEDYSKAQVDFALNYHIQE